MHTMYRNRNFHFPRKHALCSERQMVFGEKSKFRVTDNVQGQIFKPFMKLSRGYRMYK